MKKFVLLFLVFGAIIFISSCGDDCDTVVCQNEGFCEQGVCACQAGFEGEFCEILTREKLTGNYNITTSCDEGSTSTEEWAVAGSASALNEILINNFHEQAFNVTATLINNDFFELKESSLTSQGTIYTVTGTGTFDGSGEIKVDYQLVSDSPSSTINCSVVAMRQ